MKNITRIEITNDQDQAVVYTKISTGLWRRSTYNGWSKGLHLALETTRITSISESQIPWSDDMPNG